MPTLLNLAALALAATLLGCATTPAAAPAQPATTPASASQDLPPAPPPSGSDPLLWRAGQLMKATSAEPRWPADLMAGKLKDMSGKIRGLVAGLVEEHGALTGWTEAARPSPRDLKVEARFAKGVLVTVTLSVQPEAPHSIIGLWFSGAVPGFTTLAEAGEALGRLPGKTSLFIRSLGPTPRVLVAHNPDEALALGSTFKLYVLGALLADVELGTRRWEDVVRLDPRYLSLPSGRLQTWPAGAPLTLHTLAALMISNSDNTATDHLLFALGRERVERLLVPMGNPVPERNRPLLSTAELFRLKATDGGKRAAAYVAKSEPERRTALATEVAAIPLSEAGGAYPPRLVDSLEWFASTRSLCDTMGWLHARTEGKGTALGRAILAINPGLAHATRGFQYVGYKGGSEPGVLNTTFLLQTRAGGWWALSATWNDPHPLAEERYFGIVERALTLLALPETTRDPQASPPTPPGR